MQCVRWATGRTWIEGATLVCNTVGFRVLNYTEHKSPLLAAAVHVHQQQHSAPHSALQCTTAVGSKRMRRVAAGPHSRRTHLSVIIVLGMHCAEQPPCRGVAWVLPHLHPNSKTAKACRTEQQYTAQLSAELWRSCTMPPAPHTHKHKTCRSVPALSSIPSAFTHNRCQLE